MHNNASPRGPQTFHTDVTLEVVFHTQRLSCTNSSHTRLKKFLFLISHSVSFLEELLQRPGLTHAAAGLSGFFWLWDSCQAVSPFPPHSCTHKHAHTDTHTVFGCVRSAVTNADFPVACVCPTLLGSSVSCPVILRNTSISFFVRFHS